MNGTPIVPDFAADRLRLLAARATRAGYRLAHTPEYPHEWQLLDAEDGAPLHSATTLEGIARWLDE
ncbi:hypothetical protein [Nocardia blacklockiae]|uniref:hypothetical protein n=1 Tax=Nocardia blacklockiae TaxID=480036 RepID=UPI001893E1CA|nr:hypothetical protein [Nocardia blacklockiae]MBF6176187.1 hypothetical protein [Nocardia blacklockiae]